MVCLTGSRRAAFWAVGGSCWLFCLFIFLIVMSCVFSDVGFGSSQSYGRSLDSSSKREKNAASDLDGLTPFEKNFYVESPSVASMTEEEVEAYRLRREITVEGRDVPKPVREFRDSGFPGTYHIFPPLSPRRHSGIIWDAYLLLPMLLPLFKSNRVPVSPSAQQVQWRNNLNLLLSLFGCLDFLK